MAAWKENVAPGELIGPCFLNSFFITQCLVEYSFSTWVFAAPQERSHHLFAFYSWKSSAPVLQYIMPVLLLLLPVALCAIFLEAARSLLGWRRATLLRHAGDILQAITISTIAYTIITCAMPAEQDLIALAPICSASSKAAAAAKCQAVVSGMVSPGQLLLILNTLMAVGDALKYSGNRAVAEDEKKGL